MDCSSVSAGTSFSNSLRSAGRPECGGWERNDREYRRVWQMGRSRPLRTPCVLPDGGGKEKLAELARPDRDELIQLCTRRLAEFWNTVRPGQPRSGRTLAHGEI